MSRVTEKTIYKFNELSDCAKENARNWYRKFVFSDSNDWDFVYDDAATIGALIGITIGEKHYKTMGGGTRSNPAIYFSGFSCQGDGASFDGTYKYIKNSCKAIKDYASEDNELQRITRELADIQRLNFYRLQARMNVSGHYSHSGCMDVEVFDSANEYRDIENCELVITQLMRDFADWIYKQLEREYDYQNSDESIDENIQCNEYEFTEIGGLSND